MHNRGRGGRGGGLVGHVGMQDDKTPDEDVVLKPLTLFQSLD